MDPMFLKDVETREPRGFHADGIRQMRAAGLAVPQILHLLAFKPEWTDHLNRLTHEVMRGPSSLSPGMRELVAAYTSKRNRCLF